jgi:hypothetical protein
MAVEFCGRVSSLHEESVSVVRDRGPVAAFAACCRRVMRQSEGWTVCAARAHVGAGRSTFDDVESTGGG